MRALLWEGSSANTSCPQAMQDGASRLLQRELAAGRPVDPVQRRVLENALGHLTSRDPRRAWTSGQWMTERPGGSDVSRTETVATYAPFADNGDGAAAAPPCDPDEDIPLGPWSIDGFKWFSSATDSSMTILLARTARGGLSAFYAPMRRHRPTSAAAGGPATELNGVRISRLKSKMGTRSLPTAELELRGMRGWLLGEEGRGIQAIATILDITRLRTAVGALGYLGRGLAAARGFARVREVGAGRGARLRLRDSPLHLRTLAASTAEYHGLLLLAMYGAYVMGLDEHPPPPSSSSSSPSSQPPLARLAPAPALVAPLLRVLTPIIKAHTASRGVTLLYGAMESLGGVGYLENAESEAVNVARLFRDACVLGIWEGTTDVLATDLVRALRHARGGADSLRALDALVRAATAGGGGGGVLVGEWETLRKQIEGTSYEDLVGHARDVLLRLAEVLIASLYVADAQVDGDARIRDMCARYLEMKRLNDGPAMARSTKDELASNQVIVYGHGAGAEGVDSKL